jgi:acyl phosphate:glycerol-3-phosphate acyltransferase
MVRLAPVILAGYLLGSIPVAVLIGRLHRVDPRETGDRNPGYWNMKETLGRRAAMPVFIGDALKGSFAGLVGRLAGGPWWIAYVAVGAAMVGHAWPVFAHFSGGRSILAFGGGVVVVAPLAAALAIGALLVVTILTRKFAYGARVGVFGFPIIQALLEPRAHVATTGLLLSIIGLRFALAARSARLARHARNSSL